MGITFCKICKSLLYKKDSFWHCPNCNSLFSNIDLVSSETLKKTDKIHVINPDESEVLPKTEWVCSNCGNGEAFFWQTHGIGDEAETFFYRCTKCNRTFQKGGQRGGR